MSKESKPESRQANRSRAYILRLWPEPPAQRDGPTEWRVTLQDATTHTRRGFASLEEFFEYLEAICKQKGVTHNE